MRLSAGAVSLVGRVRQANEDSNIVTDDLVAVADGMGGHLAGEVASADTVATLEAVGGGREPGDLVGAVHLANRRVHDRAAENSELHGMGTTVCVLARVLDDGDDALMLLNVGDSRIYHYGPQGLDQLTEDHSLVEALVRDGRLTPEEAEVHPQRNVLTRALGVEAVVEVDAWVVSPADGDRFLLCSDGLFNEITSAEISEVLERADDPDAAARLLAERADTAGGRDNITAVVVDVSGVGTTDAPIRDRVRRVVVPPADLADLEAEVGSDDDIERDEEVDTTASLPPVLAPLADDGPLIDAGADVVDPDPDPDPHPDAAAASDADAASGSEVDADLPGDVADDEPAADETPVIAPESKRTWRSRLFLIAVALVVIVGLAAIVVGAVAGSGTPTTTLVKPSRSTTTVAPPTTASTTASTTVANQLPTLPPDPAATATTIPVPPPSPGQ